MLSLDTNNSDGKKILRDKINNKTYIKGKLLGTGGFAKCFQAIDQQTGRLLAAKVIPKKSINQKRQRYKLLIQIKIHRLLKHKHIVQFLHAFQDRQNIYILLQYCRNYTLKDLVKRRKRLTQHQTRVYITQVVKALVYIHSQGTIHRDLKLDMEAKICDFGLSTRIKKEDQVKKTICGTPNYIAPEILQQNGHSYEVDIWAIGVIMFTLLFGKPPFEDNTVQQTYENIKNNRYVFPTHISCSVSAKDLINRILVMQPSKRLGLQQILQHEFMRIPQGVPPNLPISSLAVPPLSMDKMPSRINLNDIMLDQSEEVERDQDFQTINIPNKLNGTGQVTQARNQIKKVEFVLPFIAIREIFKHHHNYGYLLTNGIVGMFSKSATTTTSSTNFLLEFGSQYYYSCSANKVLIKQVLPSQQSLSPLLQQLMSFKSFFIIKHSLFKLSSMYKRCPIQSLQSPTFIVKCFNLNQNQYMTRLSNSVIQLHFSDCTSLFINKNDQKGIYYIDQKGKVKQINYNQCKSNIIKRKIRRFSNLLQKLSDQNQEDQDTEQRSDSFNQDQYQQNQQAETQQYTETQQYAQGQQYAQRQQQSQRQQKAQHNYKQNYKTQNRQNVNKNSSSSQQSQGQSYLQQGNIYTSNF